MRKYVKKLLMSSLSFLMVFTNIHVVNATNKISESHNLKQVSLELVDRMPNIPNHYKIIDWAKRGKDLHKFVFDYTATNFDKKTEFSVKEGRKFSTIYRDDKYGGYMIPAFYGENRPLKSTDTHDGEDDQESIALLSGLIAASLLGIDTNIKLPQELKGQSTIENGCEINTYLDNALKYFWPDKGGVFTNVPNGSESKLQNTDVSNAYGDFWYLLIANQNFYRLADLNPDWRPDEILTLQEKVADKMVGMVDVLKETDDKFNIQCFDFEKMKPLENSKWRQPDAAVGTANILYYAYKIFEDKKPEKAQKYLEYAKYCMDYIQGLEKNPYYENMLIDAVYLASMMNAEVGTNYDISKFWNWIMSLDGSSVRDWGGVSYQQDGIDAYGMTGSSRGGYAFFFNTVYPMTSILPTAKYDPSYARMAGKWAMNIVNSSKYFLPNEWGKEHQTDGEYIGKLQGDVLAYEGLQKNGNGKNFYATGDAKNNATSGWMAGENTTNFGLYGGFYTGFLGALVEETNVEGILKLDCNKTDYYQDEMYKTYLYYNPHMESKEVEIDLGNQYYDLYDSVSGMYLAKNVTGKQTFKMLADSARVIVLADPNSDVEYDGFTTQINGKLVAHSKAEKLPSQGTELVEEITVQGPDSIIQKNQSVQFSVSLTPSDNLLDSRIIWSVTDENGNETDKAIITQEGLVTAEKNGKIKVVAKAIDGSRVVGEKLVKISGQTLASLSQDKNVATSTNQANNPGRLAVDGDVTTRWIADAGENNPWIYVDLEKEAQISSLVLNWETARPPKYKVQISNDANQWETISSIEDEGNSPKVVRIILDQVYNARYVRIYANEKSRHGCSIYEFDVYGNYIIDKEVTSIDVTSENHVDTITTKNRPLQMYAKVSPDDATDKRVEWYVTDLSGQDTDMAEMTSSGILIPYKNGDVKVIAKSVDGSDIEGTMIIHLENQDKDNLAFNQKVTVSHEESKNPKNMAVDGKTDTRWASGSKDQNQWITIDLGDIYNVNKTAMYWESYAKHYKIQGSIDGKTYFDLFEKKDGTGGVEENIFTAQPARYVRMQNIERGTDYGCSLWEFQVYGEPYEKTSVEKIDIIADKNEITQKHKTLQLTAKIIPEDATVQEVEWYVVNEDGSETTIASITKEGQLIPLSNGTVKVIAKAIDGSDVKGSTLIKISGQDTQNIALNKNATASSDNGKDKANDAIDGKPKTRWAAGSNNKDEYITVDLGERYIINQVSLSWEAAYARKYKIQGSLDGQTYFDIHVENTGKGGLENIYFDEQVVRYVRMQGVETATDWGYSIYEFEIYGKTLKEDLNLVYENMKVLDESVYTPNSYALLKKALEEAKTVLDNDNATLDDVNKAIENLNKASQSLVNRANLVELEKTIVFAKKVDEKLFTPYTYDKLKEVLKDAERIVQNVNVTQEEVDKMILTLQKAIESLVKRADQTQLLDFIQKAQTITKDDYTKESVDKLTNVLEKVSQVVNNANASQDEVDQAYKELKEAYDALEKKQIDVVPEEPDSKPEDKPNPDVPDKEDGDKQEVGDTSKDVQTSDESHMIVFFVTTILSGLCAYIILRKVKREI